MSTQKSTLILSADVSALNSGINQAKRSLDSLRKNATGNIAAAFSVAAVRGFVSEIARIGDLSQRFGQTAEEMQRIGYVASQNGADLEMMAAALQKATVNAQKARDGSQGAADAFEDLGINVAEFLNATPAERLAMIADGFNKAKSEGEGLSAVIAIMGKSGGELIPTLQMGGDAIREMGDSITVASNESVKAIADLDDAIDKFSKSAMGPLSDLLAIIIDIGSSVLTVSKTLGVVTGESAGFAKQVGTAMLTGDFTGISSANDSYKNAIALAREDMKKDLRDIWSPPKDENSNGGNAPKGLIDYGEAKPNAPFMDPFDVAAVGEEYGPASEDGIKQNERLKAAKRYYQFLESKRAIRAGIGLIDEKMAETNPFTKQVVGDLTARGYGGNVYGGAANPELKVLQEQKTFLEQQVKTLEKIETNTGKGTGML